MENQQLEKAAPKTPTVITTSDEYRGALLRWQERHFHVLTPFSQMSGIAPQHGLISTVVELNADPQGGDVYDGLPFLGRDEVAPAKPGLRKFEEALGISHRLEYISVGKIPFYWHVKAVGSYRGLDGSIQTREASQEWDLRDGSPRLKGWKPNQIDEGRKYGLRNCETRAINAMIRECGCGILQKYKRADLAKAFVAVRVMFIPDMSDPEVRRIVTQAAVGGTATLYPSASPQLGQGIDVEERDPEAAPRRVGSSSTAPASPQPSEHAAAAPDAVTLPEGFGFIQKVETTELARRDGKGKFLKWTAVDYTGVPHVTTKESLGKVLDDCWKNRIAVDIESEENSYQENEITNVYKHDPSQPSLLPDPDKL